MNDIVDVMLSCDICDGEITERNVIGVCARTAECRAEYGRRYRSAKAGEISQQRRQYRIDNRVVLAQRDSEKYYADREAALEYQRQYRQDNIEARRAYDRAYYRENREIILDERLRDEEWRERRRIRTREYLQRPDRACRYAKSGCTEFARINGWLCTPHDNIKARQLQADKRLRLRHKLAEYQGWICGWEKCQEPLHPDDQIEVDHIIPVASGLVIEEEWNLQAVHLSCNRSKSDKITVQAIKLAAAHGIELGPYAQI
jgi:HNH endonuclease